MGEKRLIERVKMLKEIENRQIQKNTLYVKSKFNSFLLSHTPFYLVCQAPYNLIVEFLLEVDFSNSPFHPFKWITNKSDYDDSRVLSFDDLLYDSLWIDDYSINTYYPYNLLQTIYYLGILRYLTDS